MGLGAFMYLDKLIEREQEICSQIKRRKDHNLPVGKVLPKELQKIRADINKIEMKVK